MTLSKYRLLIVDDDEDVHTITRLSLRGLRYRGRRLEFLSASSGGEAVEIMRREPGIAVVLLDVVMESENAGLDACKAIREELGNLFVRILLRTGQPGAAPEKQVIEDYDIDGYLPKPELTSVRLYTHVRTSLKAYGELMDLEAIVEERTREIQRQKADNERLLLSILPAAIAERVRNGELRERFEELQKSFETERGFDAQALLTYIPMDRRHALACGKPLPERSRGAVLFADVSGFTPLTEALARELGTRHGAEQLTRHLNRVFGALIGETHRQRGSVVGFSGDAITCFFEGDDGLRAVGCALNMQRVMGWFAAIETPTGTTFPLAIKVAVAQGPVVRLLVGDPEVQVVDLLAGATVDRMAAIAELAEQGEVTVSREVADTLGDRLHLVASRRDGSERFAVVTGLRERIEERPWPLLPAAPPDEEQVREWLNPAVYERLKSGQGQYLSELRPTVALFLQFEGLDYETDDDAGDKLDAYVRWLQGILRRFDGTLIQLTSGDKGSYFYACFGAPVALEDAADRAVAAALALRSPPPEASFVQGIRIGLSRGRMRTGAYGSETRRTYGVLGDATNLAARLMARAATGQILVGDRLAAATPKVRFRDLGQIHLRGKREGVRVLEVLGRRQGPFEVPVYPAPMVGRQHERRALAERLTALHEHNASGLVILEGEAGIGKSRLVHDLIHRVCRDFAGVRVLTAAAEALEHATPYHAWRGLGDPEAKTLHGLADAFSEESLVDRLRAVAEAGPLLIVLDNAQWLDSASWDLAARLHREIDPLLLVIALRPTSGSLVAAHQRLRSSSGAQILELDSLSRQESRSLVMGRLAAKSLPESVGGLIFEQAEGHPFYSEALADALVDSGKIRLEEGVCQVVGALHRPELPGRIESLVACRIDSLIPRLQLTLKVASVLGRDFDQSTLTEIYPGTEDKGRLGDSLADLVRMRFLAVTAPAPAASFTFRHLITREVVYNLLLHAQRCRLHRATARLYERRHGRDLAPRYSLLAHHWSMALVGVERAEPRLVTQAVVYLDKAARQALADADSDRAADFLQRALGMLEDLPASEQRVHWERDLRRTLLTLGESPDELTGG